MKNRLRNKRVLWILSVCMICLFWAGTAAAESPAEPVVQLVRAAGTVDVIRTSGRRLQRYANMGLHNGDRIHTGEDGSSWIGSKGGERLLLAAGSRLEVRTASSTPEFLLDAGSLYFHMGGQENGGMRIRTAAVALYTQDASGWLKVVDRGQVCVYLLSGTAQCSAADPVTGQIKQASLTGGRMAECTVRFEEQGGGRCEITLRDFTEEAIEGFVLEELAEDAALSERLQETFDMKIPVNKETAGKRLADAGAEWSKHMEQVQQESREYAALRDPVWKGEAHPSYAMEDSDVTDVQEEEQPETAGNSSQSSRSGSSGQTADPGTVPVIQGQVPSAGAAPAAPQSSSPSKKKGGSGSSSSDEKKPEQDPSPDPAGPTENQGLVLEGIAQNGPQGVIEVQEGGRVHVESGELFRNEGKLISSGKIDGGISNEGGEFRLTGGTVSGITQKKGSTSLEGGTVTGSLKVLGGELRMSGGTVPELIQNGGTLDVSGGVINGSCELKNGTFRMTGGTVADMTQNGGILRLSGGTVNDSCTVEGGEFCLAGGTVPDVVQKKGSVSLESGIVSGSCTVEGGEFCLAGGTVTQMIQRGGSTDINGGIINTGCQVEGGTFRMTDGTLTGIAQKEGTVRIFGGAVTDGCTVEGGRLELSGGLLRAGSAEAALTVKTDGAARSAVSPVVTAENANVHITGGSLVGDGKDKYALYAENGTVMVADASNTKIRAEDAFRTIAGAQDGSWAVRYVEKGGSDYVMGADSFDNPGGSSVIYVTRKDTEGLMQLRRLSDDFIDVSVAEAGDTLTLCGDVTYQTAPELLDVAGGTAEAPVVLDLNGRKLNLMDAGMQGGSRVQIKENAVWEIRGGQLSAWSVTGQDSGAVSISDTTVTTSELLSAEGRSTLTIRDSVIREGVAVRGSGTVEITDSEIDGRIETAQNGRMEIKDCRITAPAGTPEHTYIKNTGNGTLRISGTDAKTGVIQNTGSAVLTLTGASKMTVAGNVYNTGRIQVEGAEFLSDGGEVANQGTMNLTDGTVARMAQKGGILHMENGTITDGCTVTGGKFEMMNGKLEPGSAAAALKVDCSGSETAGQNGIAVTEENANVTIIGGTVLGTGTKKAFDVRAGRVWISDDTTVKAESAVNTIAGDTSAAAGSWGVMYAGYQMQPEKPPVLYVTRKEADGMMRLHRLEDDFEKVAKAEDGDVITLSGDVTEVRNQSADGYQNTVILAITGGTEAAPVTLDLNGKRLCETTIWDGGMAIIDFRDAAVWKVVNGEIKLPSDNDIEVSVENNSNVTFSGVSSVVEGDHLGYSIWAEDSVLTIDRSTFCGAGIYVQASTNSSVTITKSKFLQSASVEVLPGGMMDVSECQLDSWGLSVYGDGRLNVSDCSIVSQHGIQSENSSVLNISGSSVEITEGGIRYGEAYKDVCIYNNGGEINLTDISMLKMPGDIRAVGGITRITGAASGCELTASNIDITGELSISGCSMKDMGDIGMRYYGSLLDISNCTMENMGDIGGEYCSLNISNCTMKNIGNISGGDSFSITSCTAENIEDIIFYDRDARDFIIQDCYMKNTGMIRIPGGISENGKRIISNSILEGVDGILTKTYGDQNTCISNSTVSLNKPMNLKYGCTIDGSEITCTEEFQEEAMIKADWLEVIGDTVLHPNKNGVIPICQHEYEKAKIIIGGNARVIGDDACALRLFGDGETTIRDNAELVSANSRGTVLFDDGFVWSSTYKPNATLYLNGGKAVNTGTGSVVSWESQKIFSDAKIDWKIDTEVKSRTEPVLEVGGKEYMPDGCETVNNNGYYYLCMLPEQLSLELQADDQAADAAMGASLEEESTEDTEGREADLTVEEELLPSDSDSKEDGSEPAEREEKPESGTESSEGEKESESDLELTEDEKDPESDSEPTEDRKDPKSESPEGEAKPEEAGDVPPLESDGSGDSHEPSEKDRRSEDAALPSDETEVLKKEESEADQSGR